ncbi:hypothetical protein [Marinococcus halophilus]|nr:hypothetical protein [Marinococcus halophilus]
MIKQAGRKFCQEELNNNYGIFLQNMFIILGMNFRSDEAINIKIVV